MDLFNDAEFADHVQDILKDWHTPGIVIAVVKDDKISSRGFGKACLDPGKTMTTDTLFDIASSSKSLTAGAVALLVEDEQYPDVKWDAKMSKLLPDDFAMSEESYTKDVSLEDIMSHRSGLAGHDLSYKHGDTPRSITRNIRNLQITKSIRTAEQYCNMMFTVATHLIETLTKQTFADFLKDRFWRPLGMDSTHLQPDSAIAAGLKDRIFTPYHWDEEAQKYDAVELQQIPESQGAGSVFTCVNDYILWVKAMMNHEAPVIGDVYAGMVRPRIISNPDYSVGGGEPFTSPALYAAGLETKYYRGHLIVSHTGGDPGVGSYHFFLPGLKFGGVLLGNSGEAGEVACILANELIDAAIGVPEGDRPDWNQLAHQDDDEYRVKRDDQWKKMLDIPTDGDMPESEPQIRSLDQYVGTYSNTGYHEMVVQLKDDRLFIDASDRTMGFYLRLEHFKDQEKYIAHSEGYYDGEEGKMAVKFSFNGENEKAVRMGVDLEEDVDDFIWFDRIDQ